MRASFGRAASAARRVKAHAEAADQHARRLHPGDHRQGQVAQRQLRAVEAAVHQLDAARHDRVVAAALHQLQFAAAGDLGGVEVDPAVHPAP
jgi:prephenate dehydrogenase